MKLTTMLTTLAFSMLSFNAYAASHEKPQDTTAAPQAPAAQASQGKAMSAKPPMPGMQQKRRGPSMTPAEMTAKVMEQFDLSEEQMSMMQALMKEKTGVMDSLNQQEQQLKQKFEALDTSSPTYKADIFALADERANLARRLVIENGEMRFKLDSMLTPEQRKSFAQMRDTKNQMRERMKQRMQMHRGMPRGMGMPPMRMPQMQMPQMGQPPMPMPQMQMPQMGQPPMQMPQMGQPPMGMPKPPAAPSGPAPTAPAAPATTATSATAPAAPAPAAPTAAAPTPAASAPAPAVTGPGPTAPTQAAPAPAAETAPKSE